MSCNDVCGVRFSKSSVGRVPGWSFEPVTVCATPRCVTPTFSVCLSSLQQRTQKKHAVDGWMLDGCELRVPAVSEVDAVALDDAPA